MPRTSVKTAISNSLTIEWGHCQPKGISEAWPKRRPPFPPLLLAFPFLTLSTCCTVFCHSFSQPYHITSHTPSATNDSSNAEHSNNDLFEILQHSWLCMKRPQLAQNVAQWLHSEFVYTRWERYREIGHDLTYLTGTALPAWSRQADGPRNTQRARAAREWWSYDTCYTHHHTTRLCRVRWKHPIHHQVSREFAGSAKVCRVLMWTFVFFPVVGDDSQERQEGAPQCVDFLAWPKRWEHLFDAHAQLTHCLRVPTIRIRSKSSPSVWVVKFVQFVVEGPSVVPW